MSSFRCILLAFVFVGFGSGAGFARDGAGIRGLNLWMGFVGNKPFRPCREVVLHIANYSNQAIEIDLNCLYRDFDNFVITNLKTGKVESQLTTEFERESDYKSMTLSPLGKVTLYVVLPPYELFGSDQAGEFRLSHKKLGVLIDRFEIAKTVEHSGEEASEDERGERATKSGQLGKPASEANDQKLTVAGRFPGGSPCGAVILELRNHSEKKVQVDLNSLYQDLDQFMITNLETGMEVGQMSTWPSVEPNHHSMTLSPSANVQVFVTLPPYYLLDRDFSKYDVGVYQLSHKTLGVLVPRFEITGKSGSVEREKE